MKTAMETNGDGPSPLVPSLIVGGIGLIKGWPAFLSFLRFLVNILEELTMEGEDDNDSIQSLFITIIVLLALFVLAMSLYTSVQLILDLPRHAFDAVERNVVFRGAESYGFGLGTLLLVLLFVVLYNLV